MDNTGEPRRLYRWRRIKVMSFHIRSTFGEVSPVGRGQFLDGVPPRPPGDVIAQATQWCGGECCHLAARRPSSVQFVCSPGACLTSLGFLSQSKN